MKNFKTLRINDRIINRYLFYKNLNINRIYNNVTNRFINTF